MTKIITNVGKMKVTTTEGVGKHFLDVKALIQMHPEDKWKPHIKAD